MKHDWDVGRTIKRLSNLFNRRFQECSEDIEGSTGVTGLQGWIVGYLLSHRGKRDVFQKDIETEFNIGRSTATALLQRMEQNGLITRETLPGDARWKKIILSAQSLKQQAQMNAVKETMESILTKNLTEKELTLFHKVVGKIINNLESAVSQETNRD